MTSCSHDLIPPPLSKHVNRLGASLVMGLILIWWSWIDRHMGMPTTIPFLFESGRQRCIFIFFLGLGPLLH